MIDYESSKNSIELSSLNPAVKERVEKFDTKNDGILDIDEAMEGLVTLQKKSNRYKRMLWFLIPAICLFLLGTFGSTMLALNLTKEVKSTNGLLTSSKSFIPIRTTIAESVDNMYSYMFSSDCNHITKLHLRNKEIDVTSVYHDYNVYSNKRTVYMNTDLVNFSFNETGEYKINYNVGAESNLASGLVYSDIENVLSQFKYIIEKYKEMFNEEPSIEDIADYTGEFRISSSKVPKSYEVHDGVIMSKSLRIVQLEKASGSRGACSGNRYDIYCKDAPCYSCTFVDGKESWPSCTQHPSNSYYKDCQKVN